MIARLISATLLVALAACGSNDTQDSSADEASTEQGSEIAAVPEGGFYKMKPGLWQRTYQSLGKQPVVDQICLDASTLNRVTPMNEMRGIYEGCEVVEQSPVTMFGVTYKLKCARPTPAEVNGVMYFKDEVLGTDINGTDANGDMVSTGNAKTRYVGPCPGGMKPCGCVD